MAGEEDGTLVGFVMEELFLREYGIFQRQAILDTIGVNPDCQHKGIGKQLINEFMENLREPGAQKVHTLVDWNDSKLIEFLRANDFISSKTIDLERNI